MGKYDEPYTDAHPSGCVIYQLPELTDGRLPPGVVDYAKKQCGMS